MGVAFSTHGLASWLMNADPMLGRNVEIRSTAGIVYHGIVRSIAPGDDVGELFELCSAEDRQYQRFVYVAERTAQIREIKRGL